MQYRKKPVIVEAVQFTKENYDAIAEFTKDADPLWCNAMDADAHLKIQTLEGLMRASLGDWIIKGVKGEFYPCKPDIFDATYDPA
jgi:hypothetical protein